MSILLSLGCLGLAFLIYKRWASLGFLRDFLLVIAFLVAVLSALDLGLSLITGEGINDSVFYHMKTGVGGGDVSQYALPLGGALVALTALALGLYWLRKHLRPGATHRALLANAITIVIAIFALAIHPASVATGSYALRFATTTQLEEGFYAPVLMQRADEAPKNLVILYLESVERTYLDEARFPGLANRLRDLEANATRFTELSQTAGASFTVGGMVATQCGVPLILSGGANTMEVNRFMAGATCLGDLLGQKGYTLSYMGGASTKFAGKGAFYRTHGYDEVLGLDELRPNLEDPEYIAEWGLQDDTLLDLAKERFDALAGQGNPFALSVLTLDTHHPYGHADTNRRCQGVTYGDGSNPMLNSVECLDLLAAEFIEHIQNSPAAQNTVVAVMSDHLAMVNTASDALKAGPRRNLLFLIDPEDQSSRTVSRPGTTLDVGPTLISRLGFDLPRMGFGVDLLGDEPTLVEELATTADDRGSLDRYVRGFQSVYDRLWDYPDLEDGLYVNVELGAVQFGKSDYKLPALLTFDEEAAIDQATLGGIRAEKSLTEAVIALPVGKRFFWFDECAALVHLRMANSPEPTGEQCLAHGRRGETLDVVALSQSGFLTEAEARKLLEAPVEIGQAEFEDDALRKIGEARGELPIRLFVQMQNEKSYGVMLQSARFGSGSSLSREQVAESLAYGRDTILRRGVNLLRIAEDRSVEVLDRLDTCSPEFDASTKDAWRDLLSTSPNGTVAHAIVVHDTAFCGEDSRKIAPILTGLPVDGLLASSMREAYIGVIDAQGQVWEFPNREFGKVAVLLDPRPDARLAPSSTLDDLQGISESKTIVAEPEPEPAETEPELELALEPTQGQETVEVAFNEPPIAEGCIRPDQQVAQVSNIDFGALPIGIQIAGHELTNFVSFSGSWWGSENAGRWSASPQTAFTIKLPEIGPGSGTLTFNAAFAPEESGVVTIHHEGEQLTSMQITQSGPVQLPIEDLPRDVALDVEIFLNSSITSCPSAKGGSADTRALALMLKSLRLDVSADAVELAPTPVSIVTPESVTEVSTRKLGECIGPDFTETVDAPASAAPLASSLLRGSNSELVSYSGRWWPSEEDGGRGMADTSASFTMTLPGDQDSLHLIASVEAPNTHGGKIAITLGERLLAIREASTSVELKVDISDLPRETPLEFYLHSVESDVSCPAALGLGEDKKLIALMLNDLRLVNDARAELPVAIGHGGGRLGGAAITNSFDTLLANRSRFDLFELDLNWTSDGELVCLHDWDGSFQSRFSKSTDAPISLTEFRTLLAQNPGLPRNCDLDGLVGWMRANPDVRVVTDAKSDPLKAHELIASRHPDIMRRFIPQAYAPGEITALRELGFEEVIFTIYRYGGNDEKVLNDVQTLRPTALAMPVDRARNGLLNLIALQSDTPAFVHTVNDPTLAGCLKAMGAFGLYTDDISEGELHRIAPTIENCVEGGTG